MKLRFSLIRSNLSLHVVSENTKKIFIDWIILKGIKIHTIFIIKIESKVSELS